RYQPSDAAARGGNQPGGARNGMIDELQRVAGVLELDGAQQAAFDQALAAIQTRANSRQAAPPSGSPGMFGGGMRRSGGGTGMQAQMRQRLVQRYQQDFAAFRDSLDEAQQARWDSELLALGNARFAPLYRLQGNAPEAVMVRIGASDGSNTEVAGDIAEGDVVATGERARHGARRQSSRRTDWARCTRRGPRPRWSRCATPTCGSGRASSSRSWGPPDRASRR